MTTSARRTFLIRAGALASAAGLPSLSAAAGRYPDRPVRVIVPFAPGGATDNLGRWAASAYTDALGQSFIVENRAGGGTTIGTRLVATAAPDGYTLGMIDTTFVINPGLLRGKMDYDTLKDFQPLVQIASAPFVLAVNPSVDAKDMASLVALAKAKPGTLSYGSAGVGSGPHLAGEQLAQETGMSLLHVPYRGGATVFTDLLGGQIQLAFGTVPTLLPHLRAGKLRALAVTTAQRVAQLPDVPTMAEAGYPGVDAKPLFGLVAPAATPAPIVNVLGDTLAGAIRRGPLREQLVAQGFEPVGSGPADFTATVQAEVQKWRTLIERRGIQPA